MGYLDYLKHGRKMFVKRGQLPVYLVYFITDACNAKCKHCLLADGAHPGWEEPSMTYRRQELSLEEIDKVTASMGKGSLMFLLPTGGEPFLRKDIGEIVKIFHKNTGVRNVGIPTNGSTKEPAAKFFNVEKYERYADHMEREYKSGSLSGYDHFPFADFINAKRIVRHQLIAKIVRTNEYQIPCYGGNLGEAMFANGDVYPF